MTMTLKPGDRVQFDGKKTSWLVRAEAKNGLKLATASIFGNVFYTLIDQSEGVRGAMDIIGGGLGIKTTRGDDPDVDEAIGLIDNYGHDVSHRNRVALNITAHKAA